MASSTDARYVHIRSFFAPTIKKALQQASQELGPDTLILQTREAVPEARHLGVWEVVVGLARTNHEPLPEESGTRWPLRTVDSADSTGAMTAHAHLLATKTVTAEPGGLLAESLILRGVYPEIAQEIERAVRQRLRSGPVTQLPRSGAPPDLSPEVLAAAALAEVNGRFRVQPAISRITALVGPPGTGKTTALVKLGVLKGLRAGGSILFISADTQRIGGADQLRTSAAILGVPFVAVERVEALAQAIDQASTTDLVLIDTPGYSETLQQDLGRDLARFLSSRQDIDIHLTLMASTQPSVLRKLTGNYRVYRPSRLLFTRLDESGSLGSVFSEAVRQQIPLSYFSAGQLIPEDLEAATKERVTESLVCRLPGDLQAVA